jgi:hypothetical protein
VYGTKGADVKPRSGGVNAPAVGADASRRAHDLLRPKAAVDVEHLKLRQVPDLRRQRPPKQGRGRVARCRFHHSGKAAPAPGGRDGPSLFGPGVYRREIEHLSQDLREKESGASA